MPNKIQHPGKLDKLCTVLQTAKTLLIVMQDHPDPDAIATAAGLRLLANNLAKISCTLTCGGGLGRSENQELVRYLGLNLRPLDQLDPARFDVIAMVDTQPGTGNNSLSTEYVPDIVIDHHPIRPLTRSAPFTDIRSKYGAASTIIFEYIQQLKLELDVPLATALLYGIRSDTQDLGRDTTQADIAAYIALYPLVNKRMLSRIEHANVPRAYFRLLAQALKNAYTYGDALVCGIPDIDHPDVLGEVADLLLRHAGTMWVLCYGLHERLLVLSMRVADQSTDAGKIMKRIVGSHGSGGGHNTFAGGQIPLKNRNPENVDKLCQQLVKRFLRAVRQTNTLAEPLV